MKPVVNVVVGAKLPQSYRREFMLKNPLRLVLHDSSRNVWFRFEDIERSVGTKLDALVKDLLDIAVAIYLSDRCVKRTSNLEREISILIPVRNPEKWNQVKATLVQAVSFLIQNDFDIHFIQGDNEPSKFEAYELKDSEDCVCLLSGGLDSVAGALWLVKTGRNPFLVSHWSSGKLKGFQDDVATFLNSEFKKSFMHCQVKIQKSDKKARFKLRKVREKQMIQFSRSFLYLSLASAVALTLKLKDVYICENGPIALNVPTSESRLNTRTAHPRFLDLYGRLTNEVFGVRLSVTNPFLYDTKAAVVSKIDTPKLAKLVRISCSCWKYWCVKNIAKQKGRIGFVGSHCGECYPCVMRRIAVNSAGLSSFDDDYLVKVFEDYPPEDREAITLIADLLRFAHDLKVLSVEEILVKYPDFSVDVEDVDPVKLVEMYKQFANETIGTFKELGNNILKQKYGFLLE